MGWSGSSVLGTVLSCVYTAVAHFAMDARPRAVDQHDCCTSTNLRTNLSPECHIVSSHLDTPQDSSTRWSRSGREVSLVVFEGQYTCQQTHIVSSLLPPPPQQAVSSLSNDKALIGWSVVKQYLIQVAFADEWHRTFIAEKRVALGMCVALVYSLGKCDADDALPPLNMFFLHNNNNNNNDNNNKKTLHYSRSGSFLDTPSGQSGFHSWCLVFSFVGGGNGVELDECGHLLEPVGHRSASSGLVGSSTTQTSHPPFHSTTRHYVETPFQGSRRKGTPICCKCCYSRDLTRGGEGGGERRRGSSSLATNLARRRVTIRGDIQTTPTTTRATAVVR